MQINDSEISMLIEKLGEHYRNNISNRFVRPALLHMPLDNQAWDLIESLMEKSDQANTQGIHLAELYSQIGAAARFVSLARSDVAPSLRMRLGPSLRGTSDRVLLEMAINNFASNLRLFADLLNELYVKLVEMDTHAAAGRMPLYKQMPELQEIGHLLVGD
jgi:hypothetical protein